MSPNSHPIPSMRSKEHSLSRGVLREILLNGNRLFDRPQKYSPPRNQFLERETHTRRPSFTLSVRITLEIASISGVLITLPFSHEKGNDNAIWSHRERSRDTHPLALTTREFVRITICDVGR